MLENGGELIKTPKLDIIYTPLWLFNLPRVGVVFSSNTGVCVAVPNFHSIYLSILTPHPRLPSTHFTRIKSFDDKALLRLFKLCMYLVTKFPPAYNILSYVVLCVPYICNIKLVRPTIAYTSCIPLMA